MSRYSSNVQELGLSYARNTKRVKARGRNFAQGEIGCFDMRRVNAATTNAKAGSASSCLTNVVQPAVSSECRFFPFVLFNEAVRQDQEGFAELAGQGYALLHESVSPGDVLCAETGSSVLHNASADSDTHKVLATVLEAFTYAGTATLVLVDFDGCAGQGLHIEGV